jgi:hypothetical protein
VRHQPSNPSGRSGGDGRTALHSFERLSRVRKGSLCENAHLLPQWPISRLSLRDRTVIWFWCSRDEKRSRKLLISQLDMDLSTNRSMWNAPSDRDYYDPLGVDCDGDEPDICGDCSARWDRGEACEEWSATNRAEPELLVGSHFSLAGRDLAG